MRTFWRLALGGTIFSIVLVTFLMQPAIDVVEPVHSSQGDVVRPKLVVLVVFDQMRADYLKKWQPLFGDGGFKRLQTEGAWFTNCHYPFAYTLTAPGHTSMVTGALPSKHGIVANEWYDREHAESVTSVTPRPKEIATGAGPYRRQSETVGDVLLRVLMGKGRVASLSIKDRAAILMAALRANLCYWFNTQTGHFGTSAYYSVDPHSWVTKFNKSKFADQWLDKHWDLFDKELDYAKHSGPDDFVAEGTGFLQGQSFPHPFKLGIDPKDQKKNKQHYYEAVTFSPMGNTLLVEFAKSAILNEKLGQADSIDLLCISFSSNDLVGHAWGPDSQEMLDVTLRSDALLKDLLSFLDDKVGKDKYYFALCSDHGVSPLPEFAKEQGKVAERVEPELLTNKAEEFLNKKFLPEGKKTKWLVELKRPGPWVYFNRAVLDEEKVKQVDAERHLAQWLETQPGIERAFTRTEIMLEDREAPELFQKVKRSFHPDGSGDVMVILKPYHLFSPPILSKNPEKHANYRTSHGTPHPYDTHVPLLILGPRIQPGNRDQRITPQAMASILSEALGVPRPKDAQYPLPEGLFKK